MDEQSPATITKSILAALEQFGQGDYIGESISQLEHSLQAASQARNAGGTTFICRVWRVWIFSDYALK